MKGSPGWNSSSRAASGPRAPPRSPMPQHHGNPRAHPPQSPAPKAATHKLPPPPSSSPLPTPDPASSMTRAGSPSPSSTVRSTLRGPKSPAAPGSGNNVRVVARIRPPTELELMKSGGDFMCLAVPSPQTVEITLSEDSGAFVESAQAFHFDRVFDPTEGQEAVFEEVARPIVDDVLRGYNGTIFAYGQTSSGKTYTMEGGGMTDFAARGIIPRAVSLLFEAIANADPALEFTLKVSIVEIYMERIRDLLDPFKTKTNLQVREDARGQVYIAGVTEAYVTSEAELLGLMLEGQKNRAVAATGMNEGSSRSHSVFMLTVAQRDTSSMASTAVGRSSKLVLVDLAGSEMVRKTGAAGQQLEEAKTINKSLSALGLVITALVEGRGRGHVPYRDSKLTRVLQHALGGNSKLALIINLSPSPWNAPETLSTLRFGARAKGIQNGAVVNETRSPEELALLLARAEKELYAQHAVIQSLEAQLKRFGVGLTTSTLALGTTLGSTSLLTSRRPSLSHTQRATLLLQEGMATGGEGAAAHTHASLGTAADLEGDAEGDEGKEEGRDEASETAAQTMATAQEPGGGKEEEVVDGSSGGGIAAIPGAPTITAAEAAEAAAAAAAAADLIGLLEGQLAEARAELEEEREEGRRREEESCALAQIARDETAALAAARATIQTLEGELRAARQEAEEAGARHAFDLEQARLHAQRCEGEQARLSGELEEIGRRLAAAATLAATAVATTPRAGDGSAEASELATAVGHVQVLQEKLEALAQSHRLLVRRQRGVEGELGEARAQVGLRDERIQALEAAQAALEGALRRQEMRHVGELAALREQALRVAGVMMVVPDEGGGGPTAAGGGAGGAEGDFRLMGSTASFGAFDEDGSPRPRSAVLGKAAAAAALLGSTLGLTRSLSVSEPKTIRGGINATIGGGQVLAATGPLPPAAGGGGGGGGEDGSDGGANAGGILSRLREGILGTILASPL